MMNFPAKIMVEYRRVGISTNHHLPSFTQILNHLPWIMMVYIYDLFDHGQVMVNDVLVGGFNHLEK
jgi:hypothetical protein